MMNDILATSWFQRPTCVVAADLVGKVLCRRFSDSDGTSKILRMRITETEAYIGEADPACHTHAGSRTKRTEVMYQAGGVFYVYLTYGIHHLLNIVTSVAESPEAVLIRAGYLTHDSDQPHEDASLPANKQMTHIKSLAGPGKLTKRLSIGKAFYGEVVNEATGLWIEDDGCYPPLALRPRIGVDYAGEAKDWLLRYIWLDHPSLSKP